MKQPSRRSRLKGSASPLATENSDSQQKDVGCGAFVPEADSGDIAFEDLSGRVRTNEDARPEAQRPPNRGRRRGGTKARAKVGAKTSAALAIAQLEPFAVAPLVAFGMIGCSTTKGYEILPELESFMIGRARRITMASIRAYIERQLAEARASKAA